MNETIEILHHALRPALIGLGKVISKRSTLPVLGHVRVTRDRAGQVFLQGTDLDAFAVYRVPDATPGPACDYLVPFAPLQQAAKSSLTRIELVRESDTSVRLRAYLGAAPIEQVLPALPADEMPPLPEVSGPPQPVDDKFRDALRQAFACCTGDLSRQVLTQVCLDVRDPASHYLVASDGHHLFCANSFAFDLKQPVLIPNQRFLHWPGFMAEGTGELTVRPQSKRGAPWLKLSSGLWTFITKLGEGAFPEWKQHLPKSQYGRTRILFDAQSVELLLAGLPQLPAAKEMHAPVTLEVTVGRVSFKAIAKDATEWSTLAVPGAQVNGRPVSVKLNREPLLKALRFGLTALEIEDDYRPLVCWQDGRTLLIAPLRPPEEPATPQNPSPSETPASATPSAPPVETPTEATKPTMPQQNLTPPVRGTRPVPPPNGEPKPGAFDELIAHVESVKAKLKEVSNDVAETLVLLKATEREKRASNKEIESVRATLRSLQRVQL